jgi:hypothetical protein
VEDQAGERRVAAPLPGVPVTERERLALESLRTDMMKRGMLNPYRSKLCLYELKEILERHLQSPFA